MKKLFFNLLAGVLIGLAVATAILPPAKYGTHGDGLRCDQNKTLQYRYTFLSYQFMSEPLQRTPVRIGTCPYENYYVKSYSLDLWATASVILIINNRKHKKHGPKAPAA